jgi:hypothetical protein
MIRIALCLLFVFLSVTREVYASSINELAKSAVYIREKKQVYETHAKKEYELWLKDPTTKQEMPKLEVLSGTGFFISHNQKIYLVTAAHVAKQLSKKAEIFVNTASGEIAVHTLGVIQKALPESKWFVHPIADIAIHPFGFKEKTDHILLSENMWRDETKILPIGEKVYIFGFPLNLGVQDKLSPLSKKAEVASWLTTIDMVGLDPRLLFILLDQDLAQGYSGAPVFRSPEARLSNNNDGLIIGGEKLIGIQSMTISDKTGGKISLVVPLSYLKEIFESDEFKKYEETVLSKWQQTQR